MNLPPSDEKTPFNTAYYYLGSLLIYYQKTNVPVDRYISFLRNKLVAKFSIYRPMLLFDTI